MLSKDDLIEIAYLKLGKSIGKYGNNDDEDYYKATRALDEIINNIAVESEFRFNAVMTTLSKNADSKGLLGDNRFNLPKDFLNAITSEQDYRIEGEYVYSDEESVTMMYCRKIELSEFPLYMKKYLVASLCSELAIIFNQYIDKYTIFKHEVGIEKTRIINMQGLVVKEWWLYVV